MAKQGARVSFSVSASDSQPVAYQWQFNERNIRGATDSSLVLKRVTLRNAGMYRVVVSNAAASVVSQDALLTVAHNWTTRQSLLASVHHLNREIDRFHTTIDVYTDISAPGTHFNARGQLPNETSDATIYGSWTNNPRSGATCTRCSYAPHGNDYGGFYFLNGILVGPAPMPYFGEATVPGTDVPVTHFTGLDLSGATALTFWARGQSGGEKIQFFTGGVGRDYESGDAVTQYPDSTPRFPHVRVFMLKRNWQKFSIDLRGLNLTNVMGGFGWVADAGHNPTGAVFYLDDIQYRLSARRLAERLKEPRFVRSFVTIPQQPDIHDTNTIDDIDLVLRNTAFLYDNSLAILAFLADGCPRSLRHARLIGDAMVYAANHDRTYTDGRLRSAYAAGDLALPSGWEPNGKAGTVAVPGFYDEEAMTFYEVENADVDAGNNAWAMIALLALHRQTGNPDYLETARNIGTFIQGLRADTGLYQGFLGGIQNAESELPTVRTYASTEHNLDIYAAFRTMFEITGEPAWQDGAEHARQFVEAMWDEQKGSYLAGTLGDPNTRNELDGQLPLDTQSWSVLALTNALALHPQLLDSTRQHQYTSSDGFSGFDFNDDMDGVWFEGTGQMAVAYAVAGDQAEAMNLRRTLRSAQQIPVPYGNRMGTVAASHDGVSTGFGFDLFRRLHLGATAWNVFAQLGYNPYYQTKNGVR